MSERILIAISAFNEEAGMRKVMPEIPKKIGSRTVDVVVYDDGSTDATTAIAREYGAIVVADGANRGKGERMRAGLQYAMHHGHDILITMDADGQHDPSKLSELIAALDRGEDAVIASRYHPESLVVHQPPLDRQLLNHTFASVVERICSLKLTDPLCGLRAFNRRVIEFLAGETYVTTNGYGFEIETVFRLWHRGVRGEMPFRIVEFPHPAIYNGGGKLGHIYEDGALPMRLERFALHAGHVVQVLKSLGINSMP